MTVVGSVVAVDLRATVSSFPSVILSLPKDQFGLVFNRQLPVPFLSYLKILQPS
jgi:hypothetical protein